MQRNELDDFFTIKVLRSQLSAFNKLPKNKRERYTGFPEFVRSAINEKLEAKK